MIRLAPSGTGKGHPNSREFFAVALIKSICIVALTATNYVIQRFIVFGLPPIGLQSLGCTIEHRG